jgi:hypothetical protein
MKKLTRVGAGLGFSTAAAKTISAAVYLVALVSAVVGLIAVQGTGKWTLLVAIAAAAVAYGAYFLGKSRSPVLNQQVFANQSESSFRKVVQDSVSRSTRMTFIGLGLALLGDYQFFADLCERACIPGIEIRICFVDPYGQNVVSRLADEHVTLLAQPEVGLVGLRRRIDTMLETIARFQRQGKSPNVKILLYDRYPTFSTFVFDDAVSAFFYGFSITGHASPVLVLSGSDPLSDYFRRNAEEIIASAVPASDLFKYRRVPGKGKPEWQPVGVFFVPDRNSELYRWLSGLLGWDIWAGQPTELPDKYSTPIPHPGAARYFGAHVTIADAVYFANGASIDRLSSELELIGEQYAPFTARLGKTITEHRDEGGLAIEVDDVDGGFELLHHELLGCVYRASVTSEFLCNISNEAFRILGTRDRRTIARYGSPYVMTGYQPHFTLSQNLPKEDSARNDFLELIKTMRASIESSFRVEHIVLARRRIDSSYWSIADGDVFALKGAVTGPSSHI